MDTQKLQQKIKIITVIATLFVFLLVGIIVAEYIKITSLNNKIDNIKTEIETLSLKESDLEDKNSSISSDEDYNTYIEDYARRELGRLKKGEFYIIYE